MARLKKLFTLALYGVGVSSLSFLLSLIGAKKDSDNYTHLVGDALDIPIAHADVPSGEGGGPGGGDEDCEGEGGEGEGGDC